MEAKRNLQTNGIAKKIFILILHPPIWIQSKSVQFVGLEIYVKRYN